MTSFHGKTTAAVAETNAAAKRPVLLGFAFDGYGIYDNIAMDGKSIPVGALDTCNGLFSPVPGYPQGIYHYVLENVKTKRSSLGCYHGVVSSAYTKALEESIDALLPSADVVASPIRLVAPTTLATATSLAADRHLLEQLTARFVELSRLSYCG